MKKLLFSTILLLAFGPLSFSQEAATTKSSFAEYISLGPAVSFGNNWVGNMGGVSYAVPSAGVGVSLIYARSEHWGWGGQLNISQGGYSKDYNGYIAQVTTGYLTLPLRGYYFFNTDKDRIRPNLFLGPQFGLKTGENDRRGAMYNDVAMAANTGTFRTADFGLNGGAGLNIKVQKGVWLDLDLVYYQGLTDVVNDPAGRYNVNHNLGVNAGLLFGVR